MIETGKRMFAARRVWLGVVVVLVGSTAWGHDWTSATTLSPGVKHAYVVGTEGTRTLNIHCLQIDTTTPGLSFHTTPRSDVWVSGGNETLRQTTRNFIDTSHGTSSNNKNLVAAINGDFFNYNGSYANILNLAVSDGVKVSTGYGAPAFFESKSGGVSIVVANTTFDIANVKTAVSGNGYSLLNGVALPGSTTPDPRTGIGISQNNRYVYLMTIDGREAGGSDGATVAEEGKWLQSFGAYTGINVDGGGSTTMAWWNPENAAADKTELLNAPSDGSERSVGNNIGVYYVPEPSSFMLLIAALIGWMGYAWHKHRQHKTGVDSRDSI